MTQPLLFVGLDGANPLAFLSLLGLALTSVRFVPGCRISWTQSQGAWRPRLHGFAGNEDKFLDELHEVLMAASTLPFEIDKGLPFERDKLRQAMRQSQLDADPYDRRCADLLAGFGSDAHADGKDAVFLDTAFRMVRSGDSAGQGLPYYARDIRQGLTSEHLRAALFAQWRYTDDGFSLRWDPVEDQRYALRWDDPSTSKSGTVRGANALAIEALALLPVQPQARGVATTAFVHQDGRDFFTWPIWECELSVDVIRSLMTHPALVRPKPDRQCLSAMGVVEIYRSERIAPNKYYKNFTLAQPA